MGLPLALYDLCMYLFILRNSLQKTSKCKVYNRHWRHESLSASLFQTRHASVAPKRAWDSNEGTVSQTRSGLRIPCDHFNWDIRASMCPLRKNKTYTSKNEFTPSFSPSFPLRTRSTYKHSNGAVDRSNIYHPSGDPHAFIAWPRKLAVSY